MSSPRAGAKWRPAKPTRGPNECKKVWRRVLGSRFRGNDKLIMTLYETKENFSSELPTHARLIGIDLGSKTIGLALSDVMRTIATPLETIKRVKFSKDVEQLKAICAEHEIGGLIIGLPLNMDGSEGPRCQSTRQFVKNLEPHLDLPVFLWDERLSTAVVQRMMTDEADMSRARRAELVDKLAAAYILQGFLDYLGTGHTDA